MVRVNAPTSQTPSHPSDLIEEPMATSKGEAKRVQKRVTLLGPSLWSCLKTAVLMISFLFHVCSELLDLLLLYISPSLLLVSLFVYLQRITL